MLSESDKATLPVIATVFDKLNQEYKKYLDAEQSYTLVSSGTERGCLALWYGKAASLGYNANSVKVLQKSTETCAGHSRVTGCSQSCNLMVQGHLLFTAFIFVI